MSVEGGSHPKPQENMEQENFNEENIWVNLNESRNDNQSEMLQTVKDLKAELQSVKVDNERILKAQEELNDVLLNKLHDRENFKNKEFGSNEIGNETYKRKVRKHKSSDTDTESTNEKLDNKRKQKIEDSSESSDSNQLEIKKKCKSYDEITGEFKKIKPLVFNGEIETGEEVEAWLSGMKKYFQIYNYSSELKEKMEIYNLIGKVDIWWQDIKKVKHIKERYVTWRTFKKYFKRQYLSEQYYEEKAKEFYDLKLGSMTMKYLCSKFLSLLRYVPYIVDENPKIQRFISCLPPIYKERIEYDNPRTLEEAMRKANFSYEQNKNKNQNVNNWKDKKHNKFEQKGKGTKFYNKNFGNNQRGYQGNNYKGNKPYNQSGNKEKEPVTFYNKNTTQREPLKCWECGDPHYYKDCPLRKKTNNNLHIVREASTVDEIARNIPKISATLENRQADHQTSMVEVEGMLNNEPISILIDPGASLSYISPRVVKMCKLQKNKFEKSWLVQLATGTKRKVTEFVGKCEFLYE
jgi:hypothetical protein